MYFTIAIENKRIENSWDLKQTPNPPRVPSSLRTFILVTAFLWAIRKIEQFFEWFFFWPWLFLPLVKFV
jgi:hypothetical protein